MSYGAQSNGSSDSRQLVLSAFLLAIGTALILALFLAPRPLPPVLPAPVPLATIDRLTNTGIGHMEQFQYPKAVEAFNQVVELMPDWLTGKINLGIALLNTNQDENLARARRLFEEVLQAEPDNPWAHYSLGMLLSHLGDADAAAKQFEAVTRIDPQDAYAWYRLGMSLPEGSEEARKCLQRARELNPYLNGAVYGLAMSLRATDRDKAKALLEEHGRLKEAGVDQANRIRYGEMGPYAEVIGRGPERDQKPVIGPLPLFVPDDQRAFKLAAGARWATTADLGNDAVGQLRQALWQRFGGTVVVLDYNNDGKQDLFILGAVVEQGQVRDLLLRNDGPSGFSDVTKDAGLAGAWPSVGGCVGDFDNDGHLDLVVTGVSGLRLFRNTGQGTFTDVTATAGLEKVNGVFLGALFVDLDQDGDLDLVAARPGTTPESALEALTKETTKATGQLAAFLNIGEAPPGKSTENVPALKPRFRVMDAPSALLGDSATTISLAASDVDGDRDLDLVVLADGQPTSLVLNNRLLRFHRSNLAPELVPSGRWNGVLVLDSRHSGRSDLFLIGPKQPSTLLHRKAHARGGAGGTPGESWERGAVNSPSLLQALALDLDYDGFTDILALSAERKPVLLHNEGTRLVHAPDALGVERDWPNDLLAVTAADLVGDGFLDVLAWSESRGLILRRNQGNNQNKALRLLLTGMRRVEGTGGVVRCNADGFGTWITAHADELTTGLEYTTLSAGLGQSRWPVILGLGPRPSADIVRLRWPDNCWQAEFNIATGQPTKVAESNRQSESCPILFTWNGERFVFVTDFLGAGTVGESLANGSFRPPRPEESVKIEPGQLVPRAGQYTLKIANPMNEVDYLDNLQLVVVDHPPETQVYPDERFGGPPATQQLFVLGKPIFPQMATDHRGRDTTQLLREVDRRMVDSFDRRTWLGLAEEHALTLDFGGAFTQADPRQRFVLCLAGWTDYPYPESIWAAGQAGVAVQPPVLEKRTASGGWETIVADAGFPAGLPRMTTLEVTGQLAGPDCVLRLRTNMNIYYDQIFIAPLLQCAAPGQNSNYARTRALGVQHAELTARGCCLECSPDGRRPSVYDYDRVERIPVARQTGRLTRFGAVTELLQATDDRFVIFGPGEEVTITFSAELPPQPTGWTRSFVLRTWGYCKDWAPFTAHGDTVEPLPFRAMSNYPYPAGEHYPHLEDRDRWHTRVIGAPR